jgi:hypothetical protein
MPAAGLVPPPSSPYNTRSSIHMIRFIIIVRSVAAPVGALIRVGNVQEKVLLVVFLKGRNIAILLQILRHMHMTTSSFLNFVLYKQKLCSPYIKLKMCSHLHNDAEMHRKKIVSSTVKITLG